MRVYASVPVAPGVSASQRLGFGAAALAGTPWGLLIGLMLVMCLVAAVIVYWYVSVPLALLGTWWGLRRRRARLAAEAAQDAEDALYVEAEAATVEDHRCTFCAEAPEVHVSADGETVPVAEWHLAQLDRLAALDEA